LAVAAGMTHIAFVYGQSGRGDRPPASGWLARPEGTVRVRVLKRGEPSWGLVPRGFSSCGAVLGVGGCCCLRREVTRGPSRGACVQTACRWRRCSRPVRACRHLPDVRSRNGAWTSGGRCPALSSVGPRARTSGWPLRLAQAAAGRFARVRLSRFALRRSVHSLWLVPLAVAPHQAPARSGFLRLVLARGGGARPRRAPGSYSMSCRHGSLQAASAGALGPQARLSATSKSRRAESRGPRTGATTEPIARNGPETGSPSCAPFDPCFRKGVNEAGHQRGRIIPASKRDRDRASESRAHQQGQASRRPCPYQPG